VAKKKKEEKPREYTRRQLSHFQKQKRRQRIIFISGISIIVAIVVIVLAGWYMAEYRPMHRTLIKVGETKLNAAYYIDMLEIYQTANPDQQLDIIEMNLPTFIIQNELVRQAAQPLGITISDEEIKTTLEANGQPVSDAYVDIIRAQQLEARLKDEYFGTQKVPVSDNQVHIMAMLVESESVAIEARDKLVNGENFTAIVEQYAQNTYSKSVKGDFGLHPRARLQEETDSAVPLDFAFGAEAGALSPPLSDNASYKQVGYWLIKVLERPSDNGTMVQALYLSSRDQALDIKARLEAGDNLSALADQYSQYTPSKEKHGELGLIAKPSDNTTTTVSLAFDGYVFDPNTELGKWSDPISDTKFSTQGGYWLVEVIEKEINTKLSDDDRTYLIDNAYNDWINEIYLQYAADIDTSGLTSDIRTWALERAQKDLQQVGG
jgi:hypothetical protein